jgi:hypothetical protein
MPFVEDSIQGSFVPDSDISGGSFISDEQDISAGGLATEFGKGIMRGFVRIAEGWNAMSQRVQWSPYRYLPKEADRVKAFLADTREYYRPTREGKAVWVASTLGEAIPQVFTSVGLAGAGGLPLAGVNAYSLESEAARQEGASDLEAELIGIVNAGIEMWGVDKFLKFARTGKGSVRALASNIRNKLWKQARGELYNIGGTALKQATVEAIEETLQEGVAIAVPAAISQRWPTKPDGTFDWNGVLSRIGEAGLGGGLAGGIVGGGLMAFQGTTALAEPSQTEIDDFAQIIKKSKLNDIEKELFLKDIGIPVKSRIEQLRTKFDEAVSKVEEYRPTEKEAISKERGKRFGEFREILKDVKNPRQRVQVAKQALKGKLKIDIPPLESYFTSEDIDSAFDTITRSTLLTEGELLHADEGLKKMLFDGIIPARNELEALAKSGLITNKTAKQILDKRGLWPRIRDELLDIGYAPWSIITSIDMSMAGRQGLKILFNDPKLWGRSVGRAYRMFASEDYYNFALLRLQSHPLYSQAIKDGVEQTGLGEMQTGEERFMSKHVQKIPGLRPSGRAYVGGLQQLRFGWYYNVIENAGNGLTIQQRKDIATLANDLTGRGKLPNVLRKVQNVMPIFFAPRLYAAQIRSITDLGTLGSPARKILAGTLVKFIGLSLGTLALLGSHPDLDVEWNPLSADFLKIRYGNSRVALLQGYEPMIRTIFQLAAGKRKATETKRLYTAERKEILWRFIQSKLSPPAGLAVDLWRGETFLGKKITPQGIPENIYERITPLFIQDVIDTMRWQGIGTTAAIAPLAFHGITVQTYPVTSFQESTKYKDRLAKEYFNGARWDELGPEAQNALREAHPEIGFYEDKARTEREDVEFTGKIAQESFSAGQDILKKLPKAVRAEMDALSIPMPGLSRYIGNSWYLNNKRYKTYKRQVQLVLSSVLNDLIRDKDWKMLPLDVRREMIKEVIDNVKTNIRINLTTQSNIEDLQRFD